MCEEICLSFIHSNRQSQALGSCQSAYCEIYVCDVFFLSFFQAREFARLLPAHSTKQKSFDLEYRTARCKSVEVYLDWMIALYETLTS